MPALTMAAHTIQGEITMNGTLDARTRAALLASLQDLTKIIAVLVDEDTPTRTPAPRARKAPKQAPKQAPRTPARKPAADAKPQVSGVKRARKAPAGAPARVRKGDLAKGAGLTGREWNRTISALAKLHRPRGSYARLLSAWEDAKAYRADGFTPEQALDAILG